ncbi:MAG: M23 family metallopeptidase [Candidatus Firestonebacteria bacterium]
MKPFILNILLVLSLVFTASAVFSSVTLSSEQVKPGGVLMVSASTVRDSVNLNKREYRLFLFDDGVKRCFIGIPLLYKTGKYTLNCGKETADFIVSAGETISEEISIEGMAGINEQLAEKQQKRMLKIIAGISEKKLWTGRFLRPVQGRVTTAFGTRRTTNGTLRGGHKGVDLSSDDGAPVKAPARGRIIMAEKMIASGNSIVIDHGLGVVSVYFHLSSIKMKPGEIVSPGQIIGEAGSTGFSTGPHLHWGIYILGVCVDPFIFVKRDFFIGLRQKKN